MKRLFLKGKQYLNKKLEELQIATEDLDVVQEQIPARLKKPLSVLRADIDLESNENYYPYFKSHPNHFLSNFLFQKYQLLFQATDTAFPYKLPTLHQSLPQKLQPKSQSHLHSKPIINKAHTHITSAKQQNTKEQSTQRQAQETNKQKVQEEQKVQRRQTKQGGQREQGGQRQQEKQREQKRQRDQQIQREQKKQREQQIQREQKKQRRQKEQKKQRAREQGMPWMQEELQRRAMCLKEVVQEYDEGSTRVEEAVVCIAVIQFHHKRGTEVEYVYPRNRATEAVQGLIVHHAMPDSSHNKAEDYNYFNFEAQLRNETMMLFGVSCFKQLRVTEEMRAADKDLTRSFVQKAIAIVTLLPLFGYMKLRLANTTRLFFDDFSNYSLIDMAYQDLSRQLADTWTQLSVNEMYIGTDLRTIAAVLGPNELYEVWKAVLHERRVVVFAHSPSSASSFIMSLLSLFPGASFFGMYSRPIAKFMHALREYALPLRTFSTHHFLLMSFHVQDFHLLTRFQKDARGSFLVGTTNRLLKEANDYGVQLLVNLEDCTLHRLKPRLPWEPLTKVEKTFVAQLDAILVAGPSNQYAGGEDVIRNHFHSFLKAQLLNISKGVSAFHSFLAQCREYKSSRRKSPKARSKEQYTEIEEEAEVRNPNADSVNQQMPILPTQVLKMPFPNLLLCSSFAHFLQFHNPNLAACVEGRTTPCLLMEGYEYYVRMKDNRFVCYNWAEKKLSFGTGQPRFYEGKELRFCAEDLNQVRSVYVGAVDNGRYSRSGYYLDDNEKYEGDFVFGCKHGHGKLQNALYQYIGEFQNDLCSGRGQMVEGQNIYIGDFKEGVKHGCGKSQGALDYEGEWSNNRLEGSGMLTINGNRFVGTFIKGSLDQSLQVTVRYQSGAFYKGFIKNFQKEGRGYYLDQKSNPLLAIFRNDAFFQSLDTINQHQLQSSASDQHQLQSSAPHQHQLQSSASDQHQSFSQTTPSINPTLKQEL